MYGYHCRIIPFVFSQGDMDGRVDTCSYCIIPTRPAQSVFLCQFQGGRPRGLCPRVKAAGFDPASLLPRGAGSPWIPVFFGVGGGDGRLRPSPCLADAPFVVDRPPTHFLVKKKFIPIGGAETTPHAGGSFFLYEKSVLRESDHLCGRRKEVCTDLTPTPFRPSKALKKDGNPRGIPPPCAAGGASQNSAKPNS